VVKPPVGRLVSQDRDRQLAEPTATPRSRDRDAVAAVAPARRPAVIGTSQPNVTAAAAPAAEATSPSAAFRPNTASARTSSTIRSLTAMLRDIPQAGSMPGP
jgi:hypothetical protein